MKSMLPLIVSLIVIAIATIAALVWYWHAKDKEIREGIYGGRFIPLEEFERNWIVGGEQGQSGYAGYKYEDGPGCYIILIFSHGVEDEHWQCFDDVYVGQSVNICKRVHAHFNGKGNGDVYADVRNGKHVYVQFRPCEKKEMNDLERSLIRALNATSSYNSTLGGSARR